MTTIVTRAGKGSPLTHTEVDTNFTNLNTNKFETAAIPLGTLAAPSISFVGDANTGAYSPGADTLAFVTAGSNRVHITSAGLVGIGTSSPGALLHLASSSTTAYSGTAFNTSRLYLSGGAGTGAYNSIGFTNAANAEGLIGFVQNASGYGDFVVQSYAGSYGEKFRITSAGLVGIGTTSPGSALHVVGTDIRFSNSVNASFIGSISHDASTTGNSFYNCQDTGGHVFQLNGTEKARIDSSGRLLVGTSTVLASGFVSIQFDGSVDNGITLKTTYASNASNYLAFTGSGGALAGYIQQTGSTTVSYVTTSDYRLKENVSLIGDSITRLQQLKPRRFNFISEPDRIVDGFLAHEAQAVVPECVTGEKDEVDDDGTPVYQGIDQSKLVPLLTAALQEAIVKIETLEQRLTAAGID